jgi:hypothetical protein
MTEEEWLISDDPIRMMASLRGHISDRKAGLFDLVCARSLSRCWTSPLVKQKVDLDEQRIEGAELDDAEFESICDELSELAQEAWRQAQGGYSERSSAVSQELMTQYVAIALADGLLGSMEWWYWINDCVFTETPTNPAQLSENIQLGVYRRHLPHLRCIVGNPFRPVSFNASWRTSTALAIAQGMYESRDFGAMPILADALQDAGCDKEDVLNHCRAVDGVHVRGCWVVDLVLGKA